MYCSYVEHQTGGWDMQNFQTLYLFCKFMIASIEPLGQLELRQKMILQKFETFKYSV